MSTAPSRAVWPVEKLVAPGDAEDPVSNTLEMFINGNAVSLSWYANTIISAITGTDLIKTVTDYVSGDWEALQQSADAIRNLAEYNRALETSINSAVENFAESWTGNAADGARNYFTSLSEGVREQVDHIILMADHIDSFARDSYDMANGIAAALQYLGDFAIQWAITTAAAKAAAATVVGAKVAIALEAAAAAMAGRIALATVDLIGQFGNWYGAAQGLHGYLANSSSSFVKLPELPAKPYDHPGA